MEISRIGFNIKAELDFLYKERCQNVEKFPSKIEREVSTGKVEVESSMKIDEVKPLARIEEEGSVEKATEVESKANTKEVSSIEKSEEEESEEARPVEKAKVVKNAEKINQLNLISKAYIEINRLTGVGDKFTKYNKMLDIIKNDEIHEKFVIYLLQSNAVLDGNGLTIFAEKEIKSYCQNYVEIEKRFLKKHAKISVKLAKLKLQVAALNSQKLNRTEHYLLKEMKDMSKDIEEKYNGQAKLDYINYCLVPKVKLILFAELTIKSERETQSTTIAL